LILAIDSNNYGDGVDIDIIARAVAFDRERDLQKD
jgi:hypothetical protein